MKTIKEAAKHYYDVEWNATTEDNFCAGAEFAQRWIPVEEELPENEKYDLSARVLVQDGYGNYDVKRYDYGLNRWTGNLYFNPVKWRPIELK